jgi:hypothetical protein
LTNAGASPIVKTGKRDFPLPGISPKKGFVVRTLARILASLWCTWWVFFGIASGVGEGGSGLLRHLFFPPLVFIALFAVFWRRERIGSLLLILEGLLIGVGYPLTVGRDFPAGTTVVIELTMALPPLLAGVLMLAARRRYPTRD